MNEQQNTGANFYKDDDELSLKELLQKIKEWVNFLLIQWWKILIIGVIGSGIGFWWAWSTPYKYKAAISFVVEEGRVSSGGLASLVGQLGLDISSGQGVTVFSGDNILLFFKSNSLTKETLLTPYNAQSNYSLADKYAEVYGLRKKWVKSEKIGKEIFFPANSNQPYTRLQDSLLNRIVAGILKKELAVERPEKKATFIIVEAVMKDELLSKYYCERLVERATERYILSKIGKQQITVDRLQRRADSIAGILNNKTYIAASDNEKILDVNPAARTATVNAEVSSRDKMMLGTIYGEIVKNLEIAKVRLLQETPSIQIVDEVGSPLFVVKKSKLVWLVIGGFLGGCTILLLLIMIRFWGINRI